MEVDLTVLGKSTTCWYRSQISFPIPSQATKLNILKAPATGAQGTPIPAESTVPLRKGPPTQPNSRLPLRRLLRQTHSPRNQPAPPVLFYPQSLAPPSAPPGTARPPGWGRGAHVPAPPPPRQCPGERSARPAGRNPLPPTLTLAGSPAEAQGQLGAARGHEEGAKAGEAPRSRPATRPQRPQSPRKHKARRSPPVPPFRPRTSAAGAGRDARGGGARARAAPGAELAEMWAGPGLQLVLGPRLAGLELWLAVAQTLIPAGAAALPGEYGCWFWQRHHHHLSFSILEDGKFQPQV